MTLKQWGWGWALGAQPLHRVENGGITLQSAPTVPQPQIQTTTDRVVLVLCIYLKNRHVKGPLQFKPALFKGQL